MTPATTFRSGVGRAVRIRILEASSLQEGRRASSALRPPTQKEMRKMKKRYTNDAYDIHGWIVGIWRWRRVVGVVVKSKYPGVYPVGEAVNLPLYHLFWDKKRQFRRIRYIRR